MADWAYELGQRVVENAAKANNKVDLTHDEKAGADPMKTKYKATMDQITVKTPDPKCRLYWSLIEFIDVDDEI
jgi:hypothetical protein